MRWPVVVLSAALVLESVPARADAAAAEALFREGRRLITSGDVAGACLRFQESQRLDPSAGTLLNLANCHRLQGRTATAFREFVEVQNLARTHNRPGIEQTAQAMAGELSPQVPYLQVKLAKPGERVTVTLDGVAVAPRAPPIPVDPGAHRVRVTAGHGSDWSTTVVVESGGVHTVMVPWFGGAETPSAKQARPAARDRQLLLGAAAGSGVLGVTTLGYGIAYGLAASADWQDALNLCPSRRDCSDAAIDTQREASRKAALSTGFVATGVAAVALGTVLYLLTPGDPRQDPKSVASLEASR